MHKFKVAGILLLLLAHCSQQTDRGGDHVPEFKTYTTSTLPNGSHKSGLNFTTVQSAAVRSVVHLATSFHLCVGNDFSEGQTESLDSLIHRETGHVTTSGLQFVINHALQNISDFDANRTEMQPQIEFVIVDEKLSESCDLLLSVSSADEFPFSESDFSGQDTALFYPKQVRIPGLITNKTSIGFIRSSLPLVEFEVHAQRLVAQFIGLRDSTLDRSFLNPLTKSAENAEWFVKWSSNQTTRPLDALTVYTYAGLFSDKLKPSDLGTFHHFSDRPSSEATDPLLTLPPESEGKAFQSTLGKRRVDGVRHSVSAIRTCINISPQLNLLPSQVMALWTFSEKDADGRVGGLLSEISPNLMVEMSFAETKCELAIAMRRNDEFPFNVHRLNGAYFRDGKITDSAGQKSRIPLIYLNADNLSVDQLDLSKKFAGFVLEHEFAHYLGLRHSDAVDSIMSPGGYYQQWQDVDLKALQEFARSHFDMFGR